MAEQDYTPYTQKFTKDGDNFIIEGGHDIYADIQKFAGKVIDHNRTQARIRELREKFGFKETDNRKAYREKLTKPQQTKASVKTLQKLAAKARLVTEFNNDLVGVA